MDHKENMKDVGNKGAYSFVFVRASGRKLKPSSLDRIGCTIYSMIFQLCREGPSLTLGSVIWSLCILHQCRERKGERERGERWISRVSSVACTNFDALFHALWWSLKISPCKQRTNKYIQSQRDAMGSTKKGRRTLPERLICPVNGNIKYVFD